MSEPEQQKFSVANIPFLFYDVIGRTFPGGFLLLGLIPSFYHFFPLYCVDSALDKTKTSEHFLALATLLLGLASLLYFLLASFFGFILGGLSKPFVEDFMWRFIFNSKLDSIGLTQFLGIKDIGLLRNKFKAQFGSDFPQEGSLTEASFLCAYYIWKTNPTLGAMQGRWDTDLLAAQSIFLSALVLLLLSFVQICVAGHDLFQIVWIAVLLVILLGSGLNFDYHRKKRVYGRFSVFLTLANDPEVVTSKSWMPE